MKIGSNNISTCMSVLARVSICSFVRVCVNVRYTHNVRSFGMWLKLDRGMRVMLLLLRVLDRETGKKEKWEKREGKKTIVRKL